MKGVPCRMIFLGVEMSHRSARSMFCLHRSRRKEGFSEIWLILLVRGIGKRCRHDLQAFPYNTHVSIRTTHLLTIYLLSVSSASCALVPTSPCCCVAPFSRVDASTVTLFFSSDGDFSDSDTQSQGEFGSDAKEDFGGFAGFRQEAQDALQQTG